jgi:hypothetical protein
VGFGEMEDIEEQCPVDGDLMRRAHVLTLLAERERRCTINSPAKPRQLYAP